MEPDIIHHNLLLPFLLLQLDLCHLVLLPLIPHWVHRHVKGTKGVLRLGLAEVKVRLGTIRKPKKKKSGKKMKVYLKATNEHI